MDTSRTISFLLSMLLHLALVLAVIFWPGPKYKSLMPESAPKADIGDKLYDAYQQSRIVGECSCGGNLVMKYSPRNKSHFVGCSNYPECEITYSLPKGATFLKKTCPKCGLPIISFGKPRQHACLDPNCGKDNTKRHVVKVVGVCPDCGKDLVKRSGRYGDFVGCKSFPKCRFTCSLEELKDLESKSKK